MPNTEDFTFLSSDGRSNIHCRLWQPEGEVRGVVQLVHGVAEHIGRYNDFAVFLTQHGFAAAGDDHLGHGQTVQSEEEKGWFAETDGWAKIVADEKRLRDILKDRFPGIPMILLGHSMGSFMARTYLGDYPDDFDACILSGTGHTPDIVCKAGKLMANGEIKKHGSKYRSAKLQSIAFGSYLKGIENPIGPNDWICSDETVIRAYDKDPNCGFMGTAGLMRDMMSGLERIGKKSHMAKMKKTVPVLFIAGEADPVGGWGKSVRVVEQRFREAGMRDVSSKYYSGMRHEVLNEIGKQQVWDDVLAWIESKI